jgi:hypothetical protein
MRITDFPELIAPTGNDLLVTVDIANDLTKKVKLDNLPISLPALTALATKQDSLVSGTNIKTINSTSVLGSGNIAVQETLVSGTNIKTLNNTSLLGSGNIVLTANPSGVAGAIQFSNGSAFASDASNLFWDDTNNRLGVGTNAPGETLDVNGQIRTRATTGVNIMGAGSVGLNDAHIFLNQSQGAEISYGGNGYSAVGGYNIIGGNTTIGATVFRNGDTNLGARLGIRGSGSTSATTSLLVQNSAGATLMSVKDDATINIGSGGITTFSGTVTNQSGPMQALNFATAGSPFNFGTASIYNITGTTTVVTSGQRDGFLGQFTFAPTSGTAVLNVLNASPTINQTGGANGITRGLYINPTLTAAADFRAIQTTAGKIIFGGLPTSSAGLVSGQLWNDAGTLKIA